MPSVSTGCISHAGKTASSRSDDHQHWVQDPQRGSVPDKDRGGADVGL